MFFGCHTSAEGMLWSVDNDTTSDFLSIVNLILQRSVDEKITIVVQEEEKAAYLADYKHLKQTLLSAH